MIKSLIALCVISFPIVALADGTATGTVTHIYIDANYGNLVYVELSGAKSGNPACSTRKPWQFVIPVDSATEYGVMLGMVMAAQQKGSTISIVGQGTCGVDFTMETILSVQY